MNQIALNGTMYPGSSPLERLKCWGRGHKWELIFDKWGKSYPISRTVQFKCSCCHKLLAYHAWGFSPEAGSLHYFLGRYW